MTPDLYSKEFRTGPVEWDLGIAFALGLVFAIGRDGIVLAIGPFFLFLTWGKP